MDITETNADGLKRSFSIAISAGEIEERVNSRIATIAGDIKMPGFRPGKVPASVVKARYGKQLLGEVLQASLDEATRSAIEGNNLRPATNPSLNIDEYEDGGDLKATISLEIMPEIPAVELSALAIERPQVDVSETEVDQALDQISKENRPSKPVEKPRPAKMGDTVVMDFIGRIDGEAFEGGAAEGHSLELGSNSFIPGFEEGLVGAETGKVVAVTVPFPAEYPAKHLAGKEAVFDCTIHEIREPGEVKLDDEFAKTLGMDSLDALKNAIREQIGRQHATAIRAKVKTSVLDALDTTETRFDLPEGMVTQEYESVCRAMNPAASEHDHDHNHDHDHDHPAADEGMSDDDKADARSIAERRVRLGLMLTEIGRNNNMQVTEEEKQQAVFAEAQRYPGQQQQVLEYFQKNPEAMQNLAGPIFEDKVIDFILEMATVTDKTISVEDLYAAEEDEAAKASGKSAAAKKTAAKKTAAKKKQAKPAAKKAASKEADKKQAAKKPAAKKNAVKKSAVKKAAAAKKTAAKKA